MNLSPKLRRFMVYLTKSLLFLIFSIIYVMYIIKIDFFIYNIIILTTISSLKMPAHDDINVMIMNKVYAVEIEVKNAIRNNTLSDELKQEYLTATYNYLLIQHLLFPLFHEEACSEDDAHVFAENSLTSLMQEMNM